jgi:Arc/MetJ-type ribon-helix-helix transcriptional regulator
MTIHLPKDLESSIIAKVHSGLFPSLDAAMTEAARLLLNQIEQPPTQAEVGAPAPMAVWEKVLKNMEAVPDEVFERIPADSSAQLDHYLYGTPKRPTA